MHRTLFLVVLVLLLSACGSRAGDDAVGAPSAVETPQPSPAPVADSEAIAETIAAALAHAERPEGDPADDENRKPGEVLEFFAIAPGMRVLDLLAGGGYYTELLSRIVGPEGSVLFHNNASYRQFLGEALATRTADGRLSNVTSLDVEVDDLVFEPGELDAVLFILGFHDLYYEVEGSWPAINEGRLLATLFEGLKPGGILGIVDHAAPEGADVPESGREQHRIDEAIVRSTVGAAGFVFDSESSILRNPEDDRTILVFDESIRRRTDRFVLLYRKPA